MQNKGKPQNFSIVIFSYFRYDLQISFVHGKVKENVKLED